MKNSLKDCPDCGVKPGKIHHENCDVQRCSECGGQRLQCECENHDPKFSRWTGIWPGKAEADFLGVDLNEFHMQDYHESFFIKPRGGWQIVAGAGIGLSSILAGIRKSFVRVLSERRL